MRPIATMALFPAPALGSLGLVNWIGLSLAASSEQADAFNRPSFDWSALEPSADLKWKECYSASTRDSAQKSLSPLPTSKSRKFSCARLLLPLDYHNSTNHNNVSVPILKMSSQPSPSHLGTIITALGGAGNSRIQDFVSFSSGSEYFDWIDPELEYDFVTFDNRGFGYSSPTAKCFDSVIDGALWEERTSDLGRVLGTHEGDEPLWARIAAAGAKGELCAKRSNEDTDIRRHMTTVYAARDMLEVLRRFPDQSNESTRGLSKRSKTPKLKFLGLSYGTIVGQTFASLYPEHVSRMVLDGTVDAKDWVAKWQMRHLIDTDAVWASFYHDCFEAKEACSLWRAYDSNSTEIEYRMTTFLENLEQRPAYTASDGNARLITYRDVKLAMYWTTMAPSFTALAMATILDGLMRGYTNVTLDFPFQGIPTASNLLGMESQDGRASSNADAGTAVNCGDAEDITNSTITDFKEYLMALEEQSSLAAFFQSERRIRCLGWSIRPAWRFTGPFTSKREDGSSRLSTPILFIGNTLDPMTSLRNSRKVAKDFPGSAVLEQAARGHCALGNTAPSSCTLRYLRNYFRDGSLPQPGTICGEDCNLFDGSCFEEGKPFATQFFG